MEKRREGFGLKALLVVAVISLLAGVIISARLNWTASTDAGSFLKESGNGKAETPPITPGANFVELAKKLSPTVVNISTTQVSKERPFTPFPDFKTPFDDFFGGDESNKFSNEPRREFKRQSLGSGFIINKDGYILTNQHVIDNATEILVSLSESKKDYKAAIIGQDKKLDIALIKITPDGDLPVATIANSDDLQIGEWVVAIGNPFGLGGTVTAGIVSQKGRVIGAGPYDNFIQTDASINPGNSGGPLFNTRGEVVGINTAIIAGGQGIGFATPINMVKDALQQLKDKGRITRGWIGISVQELTPDLAKNFGIKDAQGALIASVNSGEPADAAGLKAGDIIVSFDGKPIAELSDIPRTVAATPPGKSVEVKVVRDGKERAFTLKVGTKTEDEAEEVIAADGGTDQSPDKKFGLTVQQLTPELAKKLGITETEGVVINSVKQESPAAEAGLRRMDVLKEINRKQIRNLQDYNNAITAAGKKDSALFLVIRGTSAIYVAIILGK